MQRTKRIIVIMWCWCLLLTLTCADNAFAGGDKILRDFRLNGSPTPVEWKVDFDLLTTVGMKLSPDIRSGNFTCFSWNYPMTVETLAEFGRLRVCYQSHVVGTDGTEYVSHALFAGVAGEIPAPRYGGVVEGILSPRSDLKGVTLTTKLNRAYTLMGERIKEFDPEKWQDGEYRRAFVLKYGTPLSETPVSELVKNEIMNWYVYETRIGLVASPWNEEQVLEVAKIISQDTFFQKLVGVGNFRLSLSPIGSALGAVLDVRRAAYAKSRNYDNEGSERSLWEQGEDVMVMSRLYRDCLERNLRIVKINK